MFGQAELEGALETLGATLQERGHSCGILIAGGSSLLLLGLVTRLTADVDVLGLSTAHGYVSARHLPDFLVEAVHDVGDALGLSSTWLNGGPAGLIELGLPDGLADRVTVRRYGALEVHLPGRRDLVAFKLYAAVDQGERSKHFVDLQGLRPSGEELGLAAQWAQTHDPSSGFRRELERIIALLDGEAEGAS